MEYVSDFMFETDFDLEMLGDARKYLAKWRLENKENTEQCCCPARKGMS
jgi:hypothetical protein